MQFQKNNTLDTKALGLEVSLAIAKFVTGKENMHYGVWDNLDPCLENLGKAQEQYTKLLFKYFPKKKKLKGRLRIQNPEERQEFLKRNKLRDERLMKQPL